MVIVDADDRIVAILAGHPDDPLWIPVINDGFEYMKDIGDSGVKEKKFKPDDVNHRRGEFVAFASGVSFGGGQRVHMHQVAMSVLNITDDKEDPRQPSTQQGSARDPRQVA